ncbi:MAG: InlB B-repeat-containing protein [Bacilli bacterium]|nr:InlB B-repeat-containing protein [Bacilli bacterium]
MKSIKIRVPIALAILAMPVATIGVASLFNKDTKVVKADELSELHTNFKLDWDGHSEITADSNYYKNFTNSGNDVALSNRTAGTAINLYDDTYSTYDTPSPIYQITPYDGYKSVQIRNYNNGGTTYYLYLNYGNKYNGSERDYGNFVEFSPIGSANTVIKSLKITTRDSSSAQNLWYKTSDDGVSWTGDLTDTYKLTYTSSTKSFDLSLPAGVKYLRVHQCNNADQSLRAAVTITQMSIGYEQAGSIKVTFDPQNGSATSSENVNPGDYLVEPPVPVKAPINGHRYEFIGWFDDPVSGNEWDFENDTVSEAGTLYAHWNDIAVSSYTVNYVSNGDTVVDPETVVVGEYFSKPIDPTKASEDPRYVYTFDGWCTDEELTNVFDFEELPVEENLILYGRYTKSIADAPAGTILYNVKNYKPTDEQYASAEPSFLEYHSRLVDSKQTFDYNSTSRPQILLDVQGADENSGIKKGKAGGEGTSEYDVVIKNSVINLTWPDKTKVLSFVRFQFHRINYQSYASFNITLKETGTDQILSSCLAPGGTNHVDEDCVQASFTAEQDVRGVTVSVLDSHIYVDLRYIILGFVDEVVENVAVNYATTFNDAQVCGTNPGDGLNTSKWEAQAAAFDNLSDNVKEYLSTYNGENAEIVEMLERYDRVIFLHGADYDFMGRIESMHIPYQSLNNTLFFSDNNTMFVVITIGAVTALAFTTFIVFKKRKQK